MSKTRMARRYTAGAIEKSNTISRDTYKRVKHMDKVEMTAYLESLYTRGYEAGYKAAAEIAAKQAMDEAETAENSTEEPLADE